MAELPEGWVTVQEAARLAGRSEAAIRKRIRAGRLEARLLLGQYLVSRASLDAWKPERAGRRKQPPSE